MIRNLTVCCIAFSLLICCQSKEDDLAQGLRQGYLHFAKNESAESCIVSEIREFSNDQLDSILIAEMEKKIAYYDSEANDKLKKGDLYNRLALTHQNSGDLKRFDKAITDATESHHQAGPFMDSSLALQKTAESIHNKTVSGSDRSRFYQARISLKEKFSNEKGTVNSGYYLFNSRYEVVDVENEIRKLVWKNKEPF